MIANDDIGIWSLSLYAYRYSFMAFAFIFIYDTHYLGMKRYHESCLLVLYHLLVIDIASWESNFASQSQNGNYQDTLSF